MEKTAPKFQKYLFVCENKRETSECSCGQAGEQIRESLKKEVKARGLASKIRVSRSGCLDVCSEGPNVLVVPDYIWLKHVRLEDVSTIIDSVVSGLTGNQKKGT